MIIQGSNEPLIINFKEVITPVKMEVSLYLNGTELKHWSLSDVTVTSTTSESVVSCPLTETETLAFPECVARLECKYKEADGYNRFAKIESIGIEYRKDHTSME